MSTREVSIILRADLTAFEAAVERLNRSFAGFGRAAARSAADIHRHHRDLLRMQEDGLNSARLSRMRAQYRAKTKRRNRR